MFRFLVFLSVLCFVVLRSVAKRCGMFRNVAESFLVFPSVAECF